MVFLTYVFVYVLDRSLRKTLYDVNLNNLNKFNSVAFSTPAISFYWLVHWKLCDSQHCFFIITKTSYLSFKQKANEPYANFYPKISIMLNR